MTLSIIGIDVSYGSCSSLDLLERFLHTGKPCPDTDQKNPRNVAQGVINDSGLVGDYQLGLLTNDDQQILDLSPDLKSSVTQLGSISSDPYSVFESIEIADQWINEDSNRVVLVIVSSEAGVGGILLTHPSRNNPAYALINSFKPNEENQIDFSHLV